MNEFEQKVFESLSDEEKDQVTGGSAIDKNTALTDEACEKLREFTTMNCVPDKTLLPKIAYGFPPPHLNTQDILQQTK